MRTTTLLLFLIPVDLTAQSPTISAYSDVGVGVRFSPLGQASTETIRFAKKGTQFTQPSTVTANHVNGSASVKVTPTVAGQTATFVIEETGSFVGQHYTWSHVGTATQQFDRPHEFLLRVPANAASNKLQVGIVNSATYPAGVVEIDVGNDNIIEVSHVVDKVGFSRELPLGTKAVDVRIRCYVLITGQYGKLDYGFRIGLTVNKDDALIVKPFGTSCGAALTITDVVNGLGHNVSIDVRGGFANAPVARMFGATKNNVSWPGSPCRILLDPRSSSSICRRTPRGTRG